MSISLDYFQKQAGVLNSKYSAAQTPHRGDTGSNREVILADWLSLHLPRSTSPEIGGQIVDSVGHVSGQIDTVIYNDNVPRFGGNPKSYYFAEGVISAIQVKSVLTSGMLTSAVENLSSVKACKYRIGSGMFVGKPKDSIFTGIFAFELDNGDFRSIESVLDALKKKQEQGIATVDFVCINKIAYIAYNKGEWHSKNEKGEKIPVDPGYALIDSSEACIFRMVLALSSEAARNISSTVDFQPYFIDGWEK